MAACKPRTILLNPGPVTMSERVRAALTNEDECHREAEFADRMLDIKRRLCAVYDETANDYQAAVLTGSGTSAVEAMLASLVPDDGEVLIVANGVYGERMATIADAHGKPATLIRTEWTDPLPLEAVAKPLDQNKTITHVATVHHETTTGRLNDLAAIGHLCRSHGKPLLLDAVSSFAAEDIQWAAWNVLAAAGTANKCLHGAPGLSFVIARRNALDDIARSNARPKSLYLDLGRLYAAQKDGFSPFTQATHVAFALQEALKEFEEEGGWAARRAVYRSRSESVRATLSDRQIRPLIPCDDMSSMLSAFRLPDGLTYEALHDAMRAQGFVIYAGQGHLAPAIFRIAVMGDIRDSDMARLLPALTDSLRTA